MLLKGSFIDLLRYLISLFVTTLVLIINQSLALDGMPKHPFLLVDEKELAELRAELAKPGWKADLYSTPGIVDTANTAVGIRSSADTWLTREIVIPGYGGHSHHFFCSDGTRLIVEPDYPFHPGPYRCPACGKLYQEERYQAAFRVMIHHQLSRAAEDLALVYVLERKPEYAAKCAEILLKYAEAYPGPHTSHIKGGMLYQSLNEAMWVIPLAASYDLIYDQLTAESRSKIEKFLRTVAGGLQKSGTGGNWASWHLSAVGVIGYAVNDRELVDWALKLFRKQIDREIGSDCIWPESVHTYHYFVVQAFVRLAEAARHTGVDLYRWESPSGKSLLKMFSAPLDYAYPDLQLPAINDGWFDASIPSDLVEIAYRETQDPRYAWIIKNTRGKRFPAGVAPEGIAQGSRNGRYAFLFGKDNIDNIPKPKFNSKNYPVLGIGVLRAPDDTSMLTFHYGPFLGHGHPSKMSVTLYANGRLWAADYGTPGYGSAILPWYKSTFSHNTVIVDNKGQAATKERRVSIWPDDGLLEAMESETDQAYPGVTYTRTVCRAGNYFVIRDFLKSEENHTYDFYFHADGRLNIDNWSELQQSIEPAARWITDLRVGKSSDMLSGRWEWASQALEIRMFGNGPISPMMAKCPAETGCRTIDLLIARQAGKSAEFITLIYPNRGRQQIDASLESGKLVITHNGFKDTLVFSNDGRRPHMTRTHQQ